MLRNMLKTPEDFYQHVQRPVWAIPHICFALNFEQVSRVNSPQYCVRCVLNILIELALELSSGHEVAQEGDYLVTLANRTSFELTGAGTFGVYMVDFIPMCEYCQTNQTDSTHAARAVKYLPEWFPGASFQKKAREVRQLSRELLNRPFDEVKTRIVSCQRVHYDVIFIVGHRRSTGLPVLA